MELENGTNNILDFFGEYDVQTYEKTEIILLPDGTTDYVTDTVIPDGVGAWDIPYICSVVMLILFVDILFKFLASILRSLFSSIKLK